MDSDPLAREAALDDLRDVRVLGWQHAVEHLEEVGLRAEPGVGRGDLRPRRTGADDGQPRGQRLERPCLLGADDTPAELDAGDRTRDRSGREDDRPRAQLVLADADGSGRRERRLPLDQLDLVLAKEAGDAAGERRDDLLAARHERFEINGRLCDLDAELAGLAGLAEDVGGAEDRLGGDAGDVEAASADAVALHDGGAHPELRGADRGHVATRSGADNDAVEAP